MTDRLINWAVAFIVVVVFGGVGGLITFAIYDHNRYAN